MEMDFLEKQVLLVSKILVLVCLPGCNPSTRSSVEVSLLTLEKSNSQLKQKGSVLHFNNEPFTGMLYTVVADDTIAKELYHNGKENGLSERWDEVGNKTEERLYEDGKRVGIHMGWYTNGQLRFRYEYENDLMNGVAEEWFNDGSKFREMHYHEGKEEGLQRMWAEDGTLRANYQAKDGRNFGLTGIKSCKNLWKDVKI